MTRIQIFFPRTPAKVRSNLKGSSLRKKFGRAWFGKVHALDVLLHKDNPCQATEGRLRYRREKRSCRAWKSKCHARHDFFYRLKPSFLSVEPDFTPGMKSGSSCPAWKSTLHARHENRLYMPGMKIDFVWPAWKSTLYAGHENQLDNCLV